MSNLFLNSCRVCGLEYDEPPWGEDGRTPLFEICVCCGVEFGYEDCLPQGCRKYRNLWIKSGANWNESKLRPEPWSLKEQLQNIPPDYS